MINDLLAGLGDAEIEAIGEGSNTLDLEAGARVFSPGDPARSLYIVYAGEIEILPEGLPTENGGVLLGPGEFFGEIALIEGHSHTSTAVSTSPTSLLELRWETMERIMESNPLLLHNLNKALAARLRMTDMRLMKALTLVASENQRLYSRASAALSVSKEVSDILDWGELWKGLLDRAISIIGAERGTVYMVNNTTGTLEGMMIRGAGLTKIVLKKGQGIAGSCALNDQSILVPDAQLDPRFFPDYDSVSGFTTRAVICAPFHSQDGTLLGVIQLINGTENSLNQDDLACLELFADQLAMGYERANSIKKLIGNAESRLMTDISSSITNALPKPEDGATYPKLDRFFYRISLAYRDDTVLTKKPVRFKTFLEKLIQELISYRPELRLTVGREKFYDGFVTTDPNYLSAVLEGLLSDLVCEETGQILISGIDLGEKLKISIEGGTLAESESNRQPISFLAGLGFAKMHEGSFKTGNSQDGKFSIILQLPLN